MTPLTRSPLEVIRDRSRGAAHRAMGRGLRVKVPTGITQAAAKYRRLSAKEAAQAGKYDPSKTPYIPGIEDALSEDHPAEVIVLMKPTQIGGTTIAQNWLTWTFLESPASIMVLLPNEKIGAKWMRSKFRPMVRATPALRKIVPHGTRKAADDDDSATMTEVHVGAAVLYLASANIGADLRMVPVRRLILDEIDEYPKEIKGQGDPIEIVMERFNTYKGRRKAFMTSTPTDDDSRIAKEYETSSQGEFFVPCPHCGHMQTLDWSRLRYTPALPACVDVRFICEQGCEIAESSKMQMLRGGEWRHRFPLMCSTRIGFKLNCLYTPSGLGDTWAENATKYERARKDPAKKRTFENTRLGIVSRGASVRLSPADLKRRALPYKLRTVPPGVLLLTCGADVHPDRIEAQIIGWSVDERMTVIDHEVIVGMATSAEVWQDFDAYLAREIQTESGRVLPIACTLVDAGNQQSEVTNYTRSRQHMRVFASKGSSTARSIPIGRPSMVDVKYRGKVDLRGAALYMVGVHALKRTLFARLQADGEAEAKILGKREYTAADFSIRFSDDLDEDYFDQLTAEKWDAATGRYEKIRDRNEALDTMILAMAAGMHHDVRVNRMREADWLRLDKLYGTGAAPEAKAGDIGTVPVQTRGGFFPTRATTK